MQNNSEGYMKYFNDAMQIHTICAIEDLPIENARILTYIHVKFKEENSLDVFYEDNRYEVDALEVMLGIRNLDLSEYKDLGGTEEPEKTQEALSILSGISVKIKEIDNTLSSCHGLENRLTSELKQRLQMYKDSEFREKMLNLYKTKISPKIGKFSNNQINQAFKILQAKQDKENEDFLKFLEDI